MVRIAVLDCGLQETACTANELLVFCVHSVRLTASHNIIPAEQVLSVTCSLVSNVRRMLYSEAVLMKSGEREKEGN